MFEKFLTLFKKTGPFLGGSVFVFLLINPVLSQQWDSSSDGDLFVPVKKTDADVSSEKAYANGKVQQKEPAGLWGKNVQKKPVLTNDGLYEDKENKINLYIKNFKISKNLSGLMSCSMDFYVHSTLSVPVSNLSIRLKWPDLEAPVSFDNVPSNKAVFKSHAFVGRVCYALDKTPNIIVNRCRAKGMSQQDCASRIEWIK